MARIVTTGALGSYMAYIVKAKSGGALRLINSATAARSLVRGFTGMVCDTEFVAPAGAHV